MFSIEKTITFYARFKLLHLPLLVSGNAKLRLRFQAGKNEQRSLILSQSISCSIHTVFVSYLISSILHRELFYIILSIFTLLTRISGFLFLDDVVYMENSKHRDEYVQNDVGKVWQGSSRRYSGKPWVFGQFDDTVLPASRFILQRGCELATEETP